MKWFKHISDSLDDPFIFELMNEFGLAGYAIFFGTIEIVARECGESFDNLLKLSWKFCARKMLTTVPHYRRVITFIATSGRFEVVDNGIDFLIRIPKLKDLADEWTQRKLGSHSGVTRKKHGLDIDIDKDIDKDKGTKTQLAKVKIPTIEEVREYIAVKGFSVDAEVFFNYYASNGWRVGRNAMKDWRAAVAHWQSRDSAKFKSGDKSVAMVDKVKEIARRYGGEY